MPAARASIPRPRRVRALFVTCLLHGLLLLVGLLALAPALATTTLTLPHQVSLRMAQEARGVGVGMGGAGVGTMGAGAPVSLSVSLSPTAAAAAPIGARARLLAAGCGFLDVVCYAEQAVNAIFDGIASAIQSFVQGIINSIAQSISDAATTSNFIAQTPLCFSAALGCTPTALDATLGAFVAWAQGVAAAALSLIVIVGGCNILLGSQMGMRAHSLSEFIPRVILTFLAALVSPMIVQAFIALNNALCLGVIGVLALHAFGNLLNSLIAIALGDGWMIFLFLIAMGVMSLLLIGQMLLRLSFLAFLGALAPLGFVCFALPQTTAWGQLWLRNFTLTVFIQFLQIAMLAIGGALLADIVNLANPIFGALQFASTFLEILMAITLLYLVFKLPGMLQVWAMRNVAEQAGNAALETLSGVGGYVADVAPELLALLA